MRPAPGGFCPTSSALLRCSQPRVFRRGVGMAEKHTTLGGKVHVDTRKTARFPERADRCTHASGRARGARRGECLWRFMPSIEMRADPFPPISACERAERPLSAVMISGGPKAGSRSSTRIRNAPPRPVSPRVARKRRFLKIGAGNRGLCSGRAVRRPRLQGAPPVRTDLCETDRSVRRPQLACGIGVITSGRVRYGGDSQRASADARDRPEDAGAPAGCPFRTRPTAASGRRRARSRCQPG